MVLVGPSMSGRASSSRQMGYGKNPMKTFIDSTPLAKEKMVAA
jgi:hypothetical protein